MHPNTRIMLRNGRCYKFHTTFNRCDAILHELCCLPIREQVKFKLAYWHIWFANHCSDRRLSTWQMIAASCLTALGALCGQLTFRLAWCRKHSTVTAKGLSQLLDLACRTLFRFSCAIQTSPTDCSDDC